MAYRNQNNPYVTEHTPSYYAFNKQYPNSNAPTESQTRTSRRVHDGLSIDRNYGLDTTSDDLNSSPYSSPYYINGRYNSSNQITQTGNSASVQGTRRLLTYGDTPADFSEADIQTTLKLWQGKQIRFKVPYSGKIVGTTLTLKNTEGCTGVLSIYLSATQDGPALAEVAVDLCEVSQDNFEHRTLYAMTPIAPTANPRGELYVRMEIWDEVSCQRSSNPYNTGRAIEIAATGKGNHEEWVYQLGEKNVPAQESPSYEAMPSRPLLGFVYNAWHSIPTNRTQGVDYGASVSLDGHVYDIFTVKNDEETEAKLLIYDRSLNRIVNDAITIDPRAKAVNLIQAADYVYFVDGYSPVRKFRIGVWTPTAFSTEARGDTTITVNETTWFASDLGKTTGLYSFVYKNGAWLYNNNAISLAAYGVSLQGSTDEGDVIQLNSVNDDVATSVTASYLANSPVVAPSLISFHCNRIWLSGFRYDPNLVQYTDITSAGPLYDSFVWRFYVPDESPLSTSDNPVTAMVEYDADRLMFANSKGFSLFATSADPSTELPTQVGTHSDGAGVEAAGDIVAYRGIVYSFDPDEGIRRFTGSLWNKIPASLDSHIERVDMSKPRKLWGYAYKLYFNYTDAIDGKAKCMIWDMSMNYQQYPWFQDVDLPFCDVRSENDFYLLGIHPDFPCIMRLYDYNVWRRLDTPITYRRDTKYISLPGNANDMILKRVFVKVISNTTRWWWIGLSFDQDNLNPDRGVQAWYRQPTWATEVAPAAPEDPFTTEDIYEQYATSLLHLPSMRARAISVQVRVQAKTFRSQANLVSVLLEGQPIIYN